MSVRYYLALLFLCLCVFDTAPGATPNESEALEAFAQANALQAEGKGEEAIAAYEKLITDGWDRSPELYFNLGIAYYGREDEARALLNFYRARLLDPGWRQAEENYQRVAEDADLGPTEEEVALSILAFHLRDLLLGGGAAVAWIAVILGVFPGRRARKARTVFAIIGVVLGLGAVVGGVVLYPKGPSGETAWLVTPEAVDLRSAPASSASTMGSVLPGEELAITASQQDWVYGESKTGKAGWLPKTDVDFVLRWMRPR